MSTQDVIDALLAAGWQWEYCGGDLPVLCNHRTQTLRPASRHQPHNSSYTPPPLVDWQPVAFAACGYCGTLRCVHGAQLGALRRRRRIYCHVTCSQLATALKGRERRKAGRGISRGARTC